MWIELNPTLVASLVIAAVTAAQGTKTDYARGYGALAWSWMRVEYKGSSGLWQE